ncbi:flagellar motor stator protein MotA [Thalassolituus sp. LLYu03]|uniref:flagellar motor stator protein MotA n=1 Tax=Thalassolituus sp. LLYu03 TaxID=3421656 RepID=UPI003D2938BC
MLFFIGLIIVIGSVLYGYVMSHGNLLALWQPFEILIICGSAFGAFILGNPGHVVLKCFKMIPQIIMGSKVNKAMYMDVLGLVYDILNKARREGIMAIEADVESPASSAIFSRYPAIQANEELSHFIADYFRIIAAGNLTSFELESLMDQEIDARLHELEQPGNAVSKVADGLPGFGIVAAVLGIVITMGAIDGEISEIGAHVAAALVGTFSGVFLAYGVVAPISTVMRHLAEEEIKLYEAVKSCIIASLNGLPPQLAVEFGRKSLFTHGRPSFTEVESKVRGR